MKMIIVEKKHTRIWKRFDDRNESIVSEEQKRILESKVASLDEMNINTEEAEVREKN